MSKSETMIVSYEDNVDCIGTTSHFIVLSGHLRGISYKILLDRLCKDMRLVHPVTTSE